MPELPEVETIRRSLHPHVVGQQILDLEIADFPGVLGGADPAVVSRMVTGRTIVDLRRRAKYLLVDLDDHTTLVIHLRMTGAITLAERSDPPARFERLSIKLGNGRDLRFTDQRKFGRVIHAFPTDLTELYARLGPEPLDPGFTAEDLGLRLQRRRGRLKSVLLDQRFVAGLGNIYVDEALFLARLHPLRSLESLSDSEVRNLHKAIQMVLQDGLANRGTSFSSFRDGGGREGENQHYLRVYGRGRRGDPCERCGHELNCIVISGRSSHFCPTCQQPGP